MGLYVIDTEYVGPGLPMWLPIGAAICEELEKLAKETEFAAGYVRVKTPHLAKEKMYLTSGHLPVLYAESMFPPMELVEEGPLQKAAASIRQTMEKGIKNAMEQLGKKMPALDEQAQKGGIEHYQS